MKLQEYFSLILSFIIFTHSYEFKSKFNCTSSPDCLISNLDSKNFFNMSNLKLKRINEKLTEKERLKFNNLKKFLYKKYGPSINNLFLSEKFDIYYSFRIKKRKPKPKENPYLQKKFGFVTEKSFLESLKFLRENYYLLKKAEKKFNLRHPLTKEIITATLKLETNFGKFLGNYRLFNALVSQYIFNERRSEFFLKQIESLLEVRKNYIIDYFSPSSICGAFGISQFMPSSLKYAVDFDDNGIINLFTKEDAIGSTANYLSYSQFNKNPKKALYSYNPDKFYVEAIMFYAKKLSKMNNNSGKNLTKLIQNK